MYYRDANKSLGRLQVWHVIHEKGKYWLQTVGKGIFHYKTLVFCEKVEAKNFGFNPTLIYNILSSTT